MVEYSYGLKIPKDRIAVLIGKKGEVKKELEEATKSKLKIDSNEGDVFISGEDSIGLFNAQEVIKAIGRGFNPDIAQMLLKADYVLEIVDIRDFVSDSKKARIRFKGRVIGSEGKSRRIIEEMTSCYVSVYGKTISIIGKAENAAVARSAVESLLKGSTHTSVYRFLEKKRKGLV